MLKESLQNHLGESLRAARKKRRLTQQTLAQDSGLSIPTLRQLERGKGRLSSLWQVLEALSLELEGYNLPPGEALGRRIATLRKRRGLSQRALARLVGVAPPTITALETSGRGRLETLQQVLTALGAGAYLAPKDQARRFFTHVGNSSVHHGWHTPPALLEKLYEVFGAFDLDPCSPTTDKRRAPVRARLHFTAEDNGLALPWMGQVFVNPPYGRQLPFWTAKARGEVQDGRANMVIALIPARTDTRWWHRDIAGIADVLMLRGRLRFGGSESAAPFPSALTIWGALEGQLAALRQAFPDAWHVASAA